jgi:uncharacterized alpha/beta hydrolase family protein
MLSFYTIVIIIAIVILIIALTIVGVTLANKKNTAPFPDYQNTCPDFWILDSNGTSCRPVNSLNTPPPNKAAVAVKHDGITSQNNIISAIDVSDDSWVSVCDKSSWAKKAGILWDGVTNNNTCV